MAHSYLLGGAMAGMHVRIGTPAGYQPDPDDPGDAASEIAAETGGSVTRVRDAAEAAATARTSLATDTWVSMGQEDEAEERAAPFLPVRRSTRRRSRRAAPDAVVLHCLPAYRGKEIAAAVHRRAAERRSGTRPRTGCTRRRRC